MHKTVATLIGVVAMVAVLGCSSSVDKTDGTVFIFVSTIPTLPGSISVNDTAAGTGFLTLNSLSIQSRAKDPNAVTSALQNVELRTYEVVYSRVDGGTRLPTPLVRGVFGSVPVDGVLTLNDLPVVTPDQFNNTPLSDLLFVNGGFDRETGRQSIVLRLTMRFFGRTLAGDDVATDSIRFDVSFLQ
jgi:hypothetical protein